MQVRHSLLGYFLLSDWQTASPCPAHPHMCTPLCCHCTRVHAPMRPFLAVRLPPKTTPPANGPVEWCVPPKRGFHHLCRLPISCPTADKLPPPPARRSRGHKTVPPLRRMLGLPEESVENLFCIKLVRPTVEEPIAPVAAAVVATARAAGCCLCCCTALIASPAGRHTHKFKRMLQAQTMQTCGLSHSLADLLYHTSGSGGTCIHNQLCCAG
jgi:hypothetical protein